VWVWLIRSKLQNRGIETTRQGNGICFIFLEGSNCTLCSSSQSVHAAARGVKYTALGCPLQALMQKKLGQY